MTFLKAIDGLVSNPNPLFVTQLKLFTQLGLSSLRVFSHISHSLGTDYETCYYFLNIIQYSVAISGNNIVNFLFPRREQQKDYKSIFHFI